MFVLSCELEEKMFPPSCLVEGEPGGSLDPGQPPLRQLGRVQLVHTLQSAQGLQRTAQLGRPTFVTL